MQGIDSTRRLGRFTYQVGTADLFDALGTHVIRGRKFTDADREGAPPVAVVSEAMAKVLWPDRGGDAIGQCVRVGKETAECTTVVGIAEDIVQQQDQMSSSSRFHYYLPIEQFRPNGGNYLLLRMRGDVTSQMETVRRALQPHMPGQSYVTVRPFEALVDGTRSSWELGATMFMAFGMLALIVAAVGLYSVIGYGVTQRMHELGVRVALGARAADIVRLVVGQGLRFTMAGVALGAALSWMTSRWVEPLLFRQPARDPFIYGAVALVLLVVAAAASASPAWRAAKADPNTALRSE